MSNIPKELTKQVVDSVEYCYQLANRKLNRQFKTADVLFNQRGQAAGSARLQQNQIRLNPTLLKDNPEHFLQQVIPHEISHLLVYQLYGRVRPHGREWQHIMQQVFSLPPETKHRLDVSKVSGKQFDYACLCGPVKLSIRRHNKVVRGQQQYLCRNCGSQLQQISLKTTDG